MKIKCPHCKHEWDTQSKMIRISCASCGRKIKKNIELNQEGDTLGTRGSIESN